MKLFAIWCGVNTVVLLWCVWAVRSLCDMLVCHSDLISDILDTIRMHQLNERMRNGDTEAVKEAEKLLKDEGYDKPEMDNDSRQAQQAEGPENYYPVPKDVQGLEDCSPEPFV